MIHRRPVERRPWVITKKKRCEEAHMGCQGTGGFHKNKKGGAVRIVLMHDPHASKK
jgi:hypothetical protein